MKGKKLAHVIIAAAVLAVLVLFIISRREVQQNKDTVIIRNVPVMGTFLEIKLEGSEDDIRNIPDAIIAEIQRIEKVFSIFSDSEAAKINQSASSEPFKCSEEMWRILMESKKFHKLSNGLFDVSIRPMMILWGFYRKRDEFPSQREIEDCLRKIGFEKILLDENEKSIFFTVEGMSLDFGGIVKGYAVDRAIRVIPEGKVKRGFVNLGGNIRTLRSAENNIYKIGVRDPFDKDSVCSTVEVFGGKALATSGNYEKYVILDNKHITHIINPLDGKPVENMLSVTVIADDANTADILSTSVFIGGEELARKLKSQMPELEFLIIRRDEQGEVQIIKIGNSWKDVNINKQKDKL